MLQNAPLFATLSTFTKLPFVIKNFVLSFFEWPFYTGFWSTFVSPGIKLRVHTKQLKFLFLNQNIILCCGYSKESSQWDGSFEHPKHMLNWWVRKCWRFYAQNFCLSKPMSLIYLYNNLWWLYIYRKCLFHLNSYKGRVHYKKKRKETLKILLNCCFN